MSRAALSLRPFVSMFARPAILMMTFALLLALTGSLVQLDSIALDLAFTGVPRVGADSALVAQTARELVIHATAIVSAALGLIVLVSANEIEATPRLAISPNFYAIMRRGSLLVMAVSPAIVWLWAHRWENPSDLKLALLWMPWWFSIGFWDRSLLQAPRAVRMAPIAILLVVVISSHAYAAFVVRSGWWPATLSLAPAVYAVTSRWSAARRALWMELTDNGRRLNWFTSWVVDRSNRLEIPVAPGTRRSVRWWLSYLRAERAENQRLGLSRLGFYSLVTVFFFITGTSPVVAMLNLILLGATVGRTLLHPLPRHWRAQLQFLDQLSDTLLLGLLMFSVYAVSQRVGVPQIALGTASPVPFSVHLAAALAMSPVTQLGRATIPRQFDQKAMTPSLLWKYAGTAFAYMIAAMVAMMTLWYRTGKDASATMLGLLIVGGIMQILCYFALRRYFATANLAPVAA